MIKALRIGLLIVIALMATSCGHLDYTVTKRSTIDGQIAAARAETEAKLAALNTQQTGLLQRTIAEMTARDQRAADYLFKGSATFATLKAPTRPEMVMGQSISQTAAQLPAATPEAQAAAFKALQTELDEAKTSTETLRVQYEKELGVARAEGAASQAAVKELATKVAEVEQARVTVLTKAGQIERDLQAAKDKVQDAALASKTEEAARAKSVQAIKMRFSSITGVLTLLCIAGAIYSPVFKRQMGIAAVALAVVTAAIWYVEGWMIAVAVGVAVVVLIAWAAKNHYVESKAASNVYHAIQSIRDTASDDYERVVKPKLTEWMTTYTKDGKTVPDQAAIAHVDEVLKATGAK